MASTVAWLADRGLVERGPHAVDRRLVVVTLTEAGREAGAEDRRRREGWLASAIERDLTERERRLLADATLLLAAGAGRSAAHAIVIDSVSVSRPALCRSILPVLYGAWPA